MLPRLAALCVACLALPQSLLADRFYFGSPETEKKMVAGTPDYVEGVLLRREDGNYVIRIKGGEISVPESSIYKIERDALTVETISAREKADAPRLARANEARRAMRAEAEQRRLDAADARREAERAQVTAEHRHAAEALSAGYDAVLHVFHTLYPPSTPVTPERTDRGLSRYIDAQEHFQRTSH